MSELCLRDIYGSLNEFIDKEISLSGWIRNHRKQKTFGFIDFYDGTDFRSLQVVYGELENFEQIKTFRNGSSVTVSGKLIFSDPNKSKIELQATNIQLLGDCTEDYPMQPKKHSLEFLREKAYLRPRTRLFQAVFKVRSVASFAIHTYFQQNGFLYVHTPLISANDGEGAGNTFTVTTLEGDGKKDYSKDFFGKQTCLAVTGQLEAETFAMAFSKVYTFGPTFRAENSNTKTHAAEFWMIEPEVAFCDLNGLMNLEEDFLKFVVKYVLENCKNELEFLQSYHKSNLIEKLSNFVSSSVARVTHKEAITILKQAEENGESFDFKPEYGEDLAKEHEKYLTEKHFNSPVFVYDWPKDIKAFYMYQNDDSETVGAVDLLVPQAGELMGGSQREHRYDLLENRMKELGISTEEMSWYLDLRKYGGCIHSGFGMGFERLIIYLTDMENIRDVIPYSRTPLNCEF